MSKQEARGTFYGHSKQVWPLRVVVARFDPDTGSVRCGFRGGTYAQVKLSQIGLALKPRIVLAMPDEFGSGIVFIREDGTIDDCGADLVLQLCGLGEIVSAPEASFEDLGLRVGARLRRFREENKLTQRIMAARLGLAPSNYHRLEHGRHTPRPETLFKIAGVLGVSLGALVGR